MYICVSFLELGDLSNMREGESNPRPEKSGLPKRKQLKLESLEMRSS